VTICKFVERVLVVITDALQTTRWSDAQLVEFAQALSWGTLSASLAAVAVGLKSEGGGNGGNGKTCVTQCRDEYDNCMKENQCKKGGWICLCCAPCSLQYVGCVAKCVVKVGGFGGIVIA
jgi:hypothetical protein